MTQEIRTCPAVEAWVPPPCFEETDETVLKRQIPLPSLLLALTLSVSLWCGIISAFRWALHTF
ncbi:MAG TPA: hypothetical protein VHC72_15210 [Bryobacteraceae bacterium]|nr:hypothetical protein [Bryobacteraceae bacterium]